jgi:DNA phosphorothioation-dependent restriction protein DptG
MIKLKLLLDAIWNDWDRPKNVPTEIKTLWKKHDAAYASADRIGFFPNRVKAERHLKILFRLFTDLRSYYSKIQKELSPNVKGKIANYFHTARIWLQKVESAIAQEEYSKAMGNADIALGNLHTIIDLIASGLIGEE